MFIFIFIFVLDFGLDFFFLLFFIFLLPSGFRGSAASGPHNPTTHYYQHYLHHQRPGPMASVPKGGPPPPPAAAPAAATPGAAATPAAAAPVAAPAAAITPAIDLSSEEGKDNASDLLAGSVAVFIPGSTTTHTKVNVAAAFGQKMSPAWAYFTKFSPAVPTAGRTRARTSNAPWVAKTAWSVLCTPTTAPRL